MSLTFGKIGGGVAVEVMLDLESFISLVTKRVLNGCASQVEQVLAVKWVRLVTASGEDLPMVDHIQVPVKLGELEVLHNLVVVENFVALLFWVLISCMKTALC